jgi:hypothetical protein
VGAYGVLVGIILGYVSLIPAVDRAIESAGRPGQVATTITLFTILAFMLLCWAAGVWHAVTTRRRFLAVVLAITTFAGGFFYYFGYVVRRTPAREPAA